MLQQWQLNKYTWMSLGYALVYLPVAYRQHLFAVPLWAALVLFALGVASGCGRTYTAHHRGGKIYGFWSTFFNGAEIVLITAAVAITGGIQSDLWMLYFVVMIFESLYATRRNKLFLDFYITLAYLAATLPRQYYTAYSDPTQVYLRLLLSRLFFLIMVSALARRISANAEARNRELLLLREQIAGSEERARIAREVHDSLGHSLVSSILRLELCLRLIHKSPEEAETLLKEEIPALRAAWNEGRDLAFHLHPWDITGQEPLPDVLRRHIGRFAERTGLAIDFKVEDKIEGKDRSKSEGKSGWKISPSVAFELTRIVQEALTNAAKHAEAKQIVVSLRSQASSSTGKRAIKMPSTEIECCIEDDGVGFSAGTHQSGVGLANISERAAALGGSCRIESTLGAGTCLTIVLPL